MKAAIVTETGVQVREVPAPVPKPNEVLVRVHASGLNRADLTVAAGHSHGTVGGSGTIVGMEFSGEVTQVGNEAKGVRIGDRVMCSGGGGYAEYAVTDWGRSYPLPENMSFGQSGSLLESLRKYTNDLGPSNLSLSVVFVSWL